MKTAGEVMLPVCSTFVSVFYKSEYLGLCSLFSPQWTKNLAWKELDLLILCWEKKRIFLLDLVVFKFIKSKRKQNQQQSGKCNHVSFCLFICLLLPNAWTWNLWPFCNSLKTELSHVNCEEVLFLIPWFLFLRFYNILSAWIAE